MSVQMISLAWPLKMSTGLKFVLVAICDAANDDGEAFLCIDTISFKTALSVRAVQSHLKTLEQIGFIRKDERPGRSSVFSVNRAYMSEAEKHPLWIKRELLREKKFKTPAESAPLTIKKHTCEHPLTGAESAPAPAESAPAPAESAPITVSYPSLNKNTPVASKSRPPEEITFDASENKLNIPLSKYPDWEQAFPKLDIDAQIGLAELWLSANPKRRKENYDRFMLGWFARAVENAKPRVFVKQPLQPQQPRG